MCIRDRCGRASSAKGAPPATWRSATPTWQRWYVATPTWQRLCGNAGTWQRLRGNAYVATPT
eukprot:3267860-Pyramimonas_sp.AAC.1